MSVARSGADIVGAADAAVAAGVVGLGGAVGVLLVFGAVIAVIAIVAAVIAGRGAAGALFNLIVDALQALLELDDSLAQALADIRGFVPKISSAIRRMTSMSGAEALKSREQPIPYRLLRPALPHSWGPSVGEVISHDNESVGLYKSQRQSKVWIAVFPWVGNGSGRSMGSVGAVLGTGLDAHAAFGGLQHVEEEHGNGHWAHPPWNGADPAGDL